MLLTDLPSIEELLSNRVLVTAGGEAVEVPLDDKLSRALLSLWEELGIKDIEDP